MFLTASGESTSRALFALLFGIKIHLVGSSVCRDKSNLFMGADIEGMGGECLEQNSPDSFHIVHLAIYAPVELYLSACI